MIAQNGDANDEDDNDNDIIWMTMTKMSENLTISCHNDGDDDASGGNNDDDDKSDVGWEVKCC